ncbi:MAG TPA: hypothetical protein ENK55_01680 [Actinobacteria bacterium]|nr:hypothetical protein [Actinomycetota bacterium]
MLRDVYRAEGSSAARRALWGFYPWAEEVAVPEVSRLARTVEVWEAEIVAYQRTGMFQHRHRRHEPPGRQGPQGRARIPQLGNLSAQMLHCGLQQETPPTANTRGHSPALVASSP